MRIKIVNNLEKTNPSDIELSYILKIVSEYDKEIQQLQTVDKPVTS